VIERETRFRRVARAPDDGPNSADDLAERCGLSGTRVRDAVEIGTADDVVVRADGGQGDGLDTARTGVRATVRLVLARTGRRLARPFTG